MRVEWEKVVETVRFEILPFFASQGVKPTLRTVFYALVSRGLIPNTKSAYKGLSRALVEARKEGLVAWDALEDRVRYARGSLDDHLPDEEELTLLAERLRRKLEDLSLSKLLSDYFDWLAPSPQPGFWALQPEVPEVWLEKDALEPTVENWLADIPVTIRVNRGYPSWTFIHENVEALREALERHQRVVVFYLGDLDPSGTDIERFLHEALRYFAVPEDRVELRRLAVTPEQVERFNLPPRPEDAETLAKLARDPRSRRYAHEYIVELDALVAYAPEAFREELRQALLALRDPAAEAEARRRAEEVHSEAEKILAEFKRQAVEKLAKEMAG